MLDGKLLIGVPDRVAIRPRKPIAVGIVNDTPVFALPGKPTGAFAALEIHWIRKRDEVI